MARARSGYRSQVSSSYRRFATVTGAAAGVSAAGRSAARRPGPAPAGRPGFDRTAHGWSHAYLPPAWTEWRRDLLSGPEHADRDYAYVGELGDQYRGNYPRRIAP